jgi:hypothetical protein
MQTKTVLDTVADLLRGKLYLQVSEDESMHGGDIRLAKKGHPNAKIGQIIVNENLKENEDVIDFIIDNIASVSLQNDWYFVRLKDNDSLVVEFSTINDFSVESSEFFLKA